MITKRCKCADPSKCKHPYQYVFELHGRRHKGSTKTANLRLATRIAEKHKTSALEQKAGIVAPKEIRLSKHIDAYLAHTKQANTTAYKDQAVLDRVLDIVGDKDIAHVTTFDLERWKSSRADEVERSTVNRELNIVRGCFSRAVEWNFLTTSPATKVKNFKVDDHRIRVLNEDELRTVLAITDPFVVLMCRATMESLARISELLGLQTQHVGPTWVEFRKKGGKVERVPVTPELRESLLSRAHDASGFIFGEGALGYPPTQQTASNRVLRALELAGVPDASHHTMRHTGVTLMLENGVNPRVIQRLAGWGSLRMLERYGHPRDAESVRAITGVASYLDVTAKSTPQEIENAVS